jgi:hypothetical protein
MGRKKKYFTEEEQKAAQREWNKTFYSRNKDRLNKNAMEKYYELRKNLQSDNRTI